MQYLEKNVTNGTKDRDIKLLTTEGKRNYLLSEPNYQTTIFFRNFISHRIEKKTQIFMSEPAYLGRSILQIP